MATVAAALVCIACSDATTPQPPPPASELPPSKPHSAVSLRLISGDSQTAVAGTDLPQPITVEVLDSAGKPVWGRGIAGTRGITDRNGRATFSLPIGQRAGPILFMLGPADQLFDLSIRVPVHATGIARPFDHVTPLGRAMWPTTLVLSRDILFSPRDTFENVVAWPTNVALSVDGAWSVRDDTVYPPSPDFAGTTVARMQAGGAHADLPIARVDDLRARRWNVSYKCLAPGTPANEHLASGALTDTLTFVGTTRAIAYSGDPEYYVFPPKGGPTPPVQVYLQGTLTRYLHDGTVTSIALSEPYPYAAPLSQRPDTLSFPFAANANGATGTIAVVQPGPLPRYVGGAWCDSTAFSVRPPVVWSAY